MSYFDYDFAGLAIESGSHSDYVECQCSHALTPSRKVPPHSYVREIGDNNTPNNSKESSLYTQELPPQ